jgi:hypothetical protein
MARALFSGRIGSALFHGKGVEKISRWVHERATKKGAAALTKGAAPSS